ncbi:protein VASCULAR ASSOCIATED DEATH 1, chloroplastic isoform X2 [Nymphaea colorata]|uniref:protein VASCULAR ASSOCIATED DEATH 1, chloroplastic isoform X2 n=1 Tax=Nymphaea colorata TaxID=210225 RepID=UPI00129D72DA|nr:protein VASCULAR ASSOCIATED DEATH 1, chloroplastic isoform X2 [Nymphaea colorata]
MATASPVRTSSMAKSASFPASGMPEIAQVRDSGGVQADTDASSVASSGPGDNGDSRSSEQAVQVLKEVEVVPLAGVTGCFDVLWIMLNWEGWSEAVMKAVSHGVNCFGMSFLSSRSEEYRQLFRLPAEEVLVQDFNCAFQENILFQGHMYLFVRYICFYANIFGFETKKIIPFNEVSSVQKAKTAGLFPNAIEIVANEKKYFFASFLSRDEAYRLIVDGWTHCCNNAKYVVDCQETRSEVSTPENKIDMFERLKSLTRPSGSSNNSVDRNKETALEEPQHVLSDKEPNNLPTTGNVMVVQESECIMKDGPDQAGSLPSETLAWKPEDVDAPRIPEHYKLVAEAKFPTNPEVLFKLFFSDDSVDFCGTFHKKCGDRSLCQAESHGLSGGHVASAHIGIYILNGGKRWGWRLVIIDLSDFQCDPWYRHQQFGHVRNVSFQHPIKLYLGAKFAQCQETQKFRVYRNSHFVLEISQQMNDAPYSDYFTVEGIWDVECDENEGNSCILRVYINVDFSKKTIWKGKIEQATAEECREAYAIWINCAHEILKKDENLRLREGPPIIVNRSIQHETFRAKRSLVPELANDLNRDVSPRHKRSREATDTTSMISLLKESSNSFISYLKGQSNLFWFAVVVLVATFFIVQLSIVFLLMRAPRVHQLPQESLYSSNLGSNSRAEAISWLERRLYYLKEEMLMVEARMESMQHEYSSLKAHLQRLERLRPKS